jgi:hypothetical protein
VGEEPHQVTQRLAPPMGQLLHGLQERGGGELAGIEHRAPEVGVVHDDETGRLDEGRIEELLGGPDQRSRLRELSMIAAVGSPRTAWLVERAARQARNVMASVLQRVDDGIPLAIERIAALDHAVAMGGGLLLGQLTRAHHEPDGGGAAGQRVGHGAGLTDPGARGDEQCPVAAVPGAAQRGVVGARVQEAVDRGPGLGAGIAQLHSARHRAGLGGGRGDPAAGEIRRRDPLVAQPGLPSF